MTTPTVTPAVAPNAGFGRLYYLEFTIPAGTPISAPVSDTWPLEDNYLVSIVTRIPPGPSGLMGFRIMWAQQQIVPWGNNSWLIADDEEIVWQSNTAMTVSGLVVEGYNTGTYAHTVYLRALISTLPPSVLQEIDQEMGTVALPASQVGPESGDVNSYVAPSTDVGEETESSELETGEPEEVQPTISPDVSLVGVS
jgi:hypothetical protein